MIGRSDVNLLFDDVIHKIVVIVCGGCHKNCLAVLRFNIEPPFAVEGTYQNLTVVVADSSKNFPVRRFIKGERGGTSDSKAGKSLAHS